MNIDICITHMSKTVLMTMFHMGINKANGNPSSKLRILTKKATFSHLKLAIGWHFKVATFWSGKAATISQMNLAANSHISSQGIYNAYDVKQKKDPKVLFLHAIENYFGAVFFTFGDLPRIVSPRNFIYCELCTKRSKIASAIVLLSM